MVTKICLRTFQVIFYPFLGYQHPISIIKTEFNAFKISKKKV